MHHKTNLTLIKYALLDEWLPEREDNSANMDDTMANFNHIQSFQKEDKVDVRKENEDKKEALYYILQLEKWLNWEIRVMN